MNKDVVFYEIRNDSIYPNTYVYTFSYKKWSVIVDITYKSEDYKETGYTYMVNKFINHCAYDIDIKSGTKEFSGTIEDEMSFINGVIVPEIIKKVDSGLYERKYKRILKKNEEEDRIARINYLLEKETNDN